MFRAFGLSFLFSILCFTEIVAQANSYTQTIPGTDFSIDLVLIPAGSFRIGSPESETDRQANEALMAKLQVPAFYMSAHEITYDQFLAFREKDFDSPEATQANYQIDAVSRPTPPYLDFTNGMGSRDGFPAVSMTQQAALRYCKWLYQKTGVFYRLPTEAEWEYACRAGSNTAYYYGDDADALEQYAWYFDNANDKYQKVGQKKPNAWGLFDMLGNVAEYTADQYHKDRTGFIDPKSPQVIMSMPKGTYGRVVKGGAYDDDADACRCAYRIASTAKWQARDPQIPKSIWWNPDSPFVGFRIVRPLGDFSEKEISQYFEKVLID